VTISNETTTLGRSLLLLQAQGLLKLKPGVGYLPTTLDIIDNPKQLKIVEVDTPQLTRTLMIRTSACQSLTPTSPPRRACRPPATVCLWRDRIPLT
jgi:hypothetical protein